MIQAGSQVVVVPGAVPHRHVFGVIAHILGIDTPALRRVAGVHGSWIGRNPIVEEGLEQPGVQKTKRHQILAEGVLGPAGDVIR